MKIKTSKILPPKGFIAINLFGVIFVRQGTVLSPKTINHEMIHTAQIKEMLYIFFYLWYGVEWLIRWVGCGFKGMEAYYNISFEKEAYTNAANPNYLKNRKRFAWMR